MAPRRQRLAQRRKAVGFTQEVLAERLGVERSTVVRWVRWEAGDTEPSPWRRPKIAYLLQVSLNHLEGLLEQTSEPAHIDAPHVLPNAPRLRRRMLMFRRYTVSARLTSRWVAVTCTPRW